MPVLIALFAGITASASLASLALWQRRSSVSSRRLRRVAAADVDPLAQSIVERALRPLALQGGMMLRRVMPPRLVAALDARLVTAGLSIYDTMQYIRCDVATLCIGQAASMGSLLMTAGAKGKRFALPHARIMTHQPSGGFQGQAGATAPLGTCRCIGSGMKLFS